MTFSTTQFPCERQSGLGEHAGRSDARVDVAWSLMITLAAPKQPPRAGTYGPRDRGDQLQASTGNTARVRGALGSRQSGFSIGAGIETVGGRTP